MTLEEARKVSDIIVGTMCTSCVPKLVEEANKKFPEFTFAYHDRIGIVLVSENHPTQAQLQTADERARYGL